MSSTFAATGDRPLPLPPRRCTRLLRSFLDVRNVWIVEVQCERSRHRYGKTGGDYHRRGSPSWIGWILAGATVHAVTPAFLFSSAARSLWPPGPWAYITANAGCLVKTLFPRPHLSGGRVRPGRGRRRRRQRLLDREVFGFAARIRLVSALLFGTSRERKI